MSRTRAGRRGARYSGLSIPRSLRSAGHRAVVVAVLVGLVAGPGAAAAGAVEPGGAAQQATPTANGTDVGVQHERPENVTGEGDPEELARWLEGRLAERLGDSAINVSEGQYERADELLGEEYQHRLDQYVDVAGETDGEGDDRTAERLSEARETQRAYVDAVRSSRSEYEAYREARAAGNTSAARQHARAVIRQSDRTGRLGESLHANLGQIEDGTGQSLDESQAAVENTTENVTELRDEVVATFRATDLTVATNGSTVAFTDPLLIEGQVTDANGSAVANQRGRVVVHDRTYAVETNDEGRFAVAYRPVTLPVNASAVAVEFVPPNASAYLAATANASVAVEPVTPTLELRVSPGEVEYGQRFDATVRATVDGRPVPDVAVGSTVAGGLHEDARTGEGGYARIERELPAAVEPGEVTVRAATGAPGRAIGPANASASITVLETATDLSVDADRSESTVVVSGRLRTSDDEAVAGRQVSVAVAGERVGTAETNESGAYRLAVDRADLPANASEQVAVVARFDGSGTNLDSTRARTTLSMPDAWGGAGNGAGAGGLGMVSRDMLIAGGVVGISLAGLAAALWWRRSLDADDVDGVADGVDDADESAVTASSSADSRMAPLNRARTALADGDVETAVVTAYAASRRHLEDRVSLPGHLTHREFEAACDAHLDAPERAALTTVTDAYERVSFAGEGAVDAEDAVDAAAVLVDGESERSGD